jgi:hypothetical protein
VTAIAGARLHDRADGRASARLRASELRPRFRTIQVCPKDLRTCAVRLLMRQTACAWRLTTCYDSQRHLAGSPCPA